MKVKFTKGQGENLTPKKEYDATKLSEKNEMGVAMFKIKDDMGNMLFCLLGETCAHLEGGNWEVVSTDEIE